MMKKHKSMFNKKRNFSSFAQRKSKRKVLIISACAGIAVIIIGAIGFKLTHSTPQKTAQNIQNQTAKRGPTNNPTPAQGENNAQSNKTLIGANGKATLPAKPTASPVSNACKVQNTGTKALMTALKAENSLHSQFKSTEKTAIESENKRHQVAVVAIMGAYRSKIVAAGKCI